LKPTWIIPPVTDLWHCNVIGIETAALDISFNGFHLSLRMTVCNYLSVPFVSRQFVSYNIKKALYNNRTYWQLIGAKK